MVSSMRGIEHDCSHGQGSVRRAREKPKKATKAKLPLVEEPKKRWKIGRVARSVVVYLKKWFRDTAHATAVSIGVTIFTGIIFATWAQVKYDWVGWSKDEIGEWVTTTKPAE